MNSIITIDNISIKQDNEGRYSLNDLHKAAGGANKLKPSLYLRMDSTGDLVRAIECTDSCITPVVAKRGFNGGTYVCPEVVISYGMWISPQFALKVIRTFLQLEKHGVVIHEKAVDDFRKNPAKYEEELARQAAELEAERKARKALEEKFFQEAVPSGNRTPGDYLNEVSPIKPSRDAVLAFGELCASVSRLHDWPIYTKVTVKGIGGARDEEQRFYHPKALDAAFEAHIAKVFKPTKYGHTMPSLP